MSKCATLIKLDSCPSIWLSHDPTFSLCTICCLMNPCLRHCWRINLNFTGVLSLQYLIRRFRSCKCFTKFSKSKSIHLQKRNRATKLDRFGKDSLTIKRRNAGVRIKMRVVHSCHRAVVITILIVKLNLKISRLVKGSIRCSTMHALLVTLKSFISSKINARISVICYLIVRWTRHKRRHCTGQLQLTKKRLSNF